MSNSKDKARYFTGLLYPDSAPEFDEMISALEKIGQPIAISPIHDKDKSKHKGQEFKKAHYHFIYVANNPVTENSVVKRVKRAFGESYSKAIAKVQIVDNIENMYLYLTHESKDAIAKNKHRYDKADIKLLNNFDIDRYISLSVEDKKDLLKAVTQIIVVKKLANIIELEYWVEQEGDGYGLDRNDILTLAESYGGVLRLYFDGVYQKSMQQAEKK